jgi:hypothetical protein
MTSTIPAGLTTSYLSPGVAEIHLGDLQVGMVTWNPEPLTATHYATYANGDETVACPSMEAALECIRLQHAAVQRFARSLRSIRPASGSSQQDPRGISWDYGYNTALRDVERVTQELVGQAPNGEGYTAITR